MGLFFFVRYIYARLSFLFLFKKKVVDYLGLQHVLDGNPLGHFAVKKIAVGNSHSYLLKILTEVRLLERLHHPNIITYQYVFLHHIEAFCLNT